MAETTRLPRSYDNSYDPTYRTKVCTKCGCRLPLESFAMRTDQGVTRRRRMCRDCKHAQVRRRQHQNPDVAARARDRVVTRMRQRREALVAIKLERGCADCGYRDYGAALDFDHRPDTEKLFMIMRDGLSRNWESVLAEVAKCDVVCANCHRVRTWKRQNESLDEVRGQLPVA